MTQNANYQWKCEPKAENLVLSILEVCVQSNSFIAQLRQDLLRHTSTRLFDWLDHVIVGSSSAIELEIEQTGFISESVTPTYRVFMHPGAQLPRIVVKDHGQPVIGCALAVESIADFLMVRGMTGLIEGSYLSPYRRCCVATDNGVSIWVVERRGTPNIEPTYPEETYLEKYLEAVEKWQTRPRSFEDDDELMRYTINIAQEMIHLVGEDIAAFIVLDIERKFWQSRNTAGQIQKNRQDRLGMGWANHDHHTFRSSRKQFTSLIRLAEMLGFHCRERFYAGKEAGWGAQVMENPRAKLVFFLDVDLDDNEVESDFAHHPLPTLNRLGTIGLWCGLHGDSILQSGMHHLEAQFMFDELTKDLATAGIKMMDPFSKNAHLMQAFTAGEIWQPDSKRIDKLLKEGKITQIEAEKFKTHGAIGSHMENLQRREGFKGFNQKNVSTIIKKTDPRALEV